MQLQKVQRNKKNEELEQKVKVTHTLTYSHVLFNDDIEGVSQKEPS